MTKKKSFLEFISENRFIHVLLSILLGFVVFMICIAVCFVKQHSALDVLAALPVCLLAEYLTFHVFFKAKRAV